jgi:chromosome segregation ATPase
VSRTPSPETQAKTLRRQLNATERELQDALSHCDKLQKRAVAAERELAEWKARFDKLLDNVPKLKGAAHG